MRAIVIGSGHNALVAAAYLARGGVGVTVCERRDVVGGATVTEEIVPGFRASTASYALSLLRPDIFSELELGRHGLVAVAKDPQMFVPLLDGRHFFVWRDSGRTCAEIERIHLGDADGYRRWCAFWDEAVALLRPLVEAVDPPSLAEVERQLPDDVWRLAVAGSAAETVSEFFECPEVQGAFASQGIIGTWASVRDPGTAWVMAYHAIGGEIYGSSGTWGFVRGGMGSVSRALTAAALEAGAEIRCASPVEEILIEDGAAVGVTLSDGTTLPADVVVSGVHPQTTFVDLVPSLPDDFAARVREWRSPGCVVKVNLAFSELPNFVPFPGDTVGDQHRGTLEISPSIDYLHDAYTAATGGAPSPRPFIEAFVQSALDPTLVDGPGHVLSAFTQYAPPDGNFSVQDATKNVIDTLAQYAPNLPDSIVGVDALGPLELEQRFGLVGGNIFHGEILPEQSFGERFDYRTPVKGLYLCGSGARPGGAVMGAAGRNAARVVLQDFGRG